MNEWAFKDGSVSIIATSCNCLHFFWAIFFSSPERFKIMGHRRSRFLRRCFSAKSVIKCKIYYQFFFHQKYIYMQRNTYCLYFYITLTLCYKFPYLMSLLKKKSWENTRADPEIGQLRLVSKYNWLYVICIREIHWTKAFIKSIIFHFSKQQLI